MAVSHDQIVRFIEEFRCFAEDKLKNGGAESVQDLVELWRRENPTLLEQEAALESIRQGIDDADAGRTVSVEQAFADARKAVVGLK